MSAPEHQKQRARLCAQVPKFVRPDSADLRSASQLLASYSNAKHTYQAPAQAWAALGHLWCRSDTCLVLQTPSEVFADTGPLTGNMVSPYLCVRASAPSARQCPTYDGPVDVRLCSLCAPTTTQSHVHLQQGAM